MTLEQKGAYSMVLDMIYDYGGPIPDDSQWIARVCGCSTRKWNQIRQFLIDRGKIHVGDGMISNDRAIKQLLSGGEEHDKFVINGAKGADKTNEKKASLKNNNGLAEKGPTPSVQPSGRHTRCQTPESEEDIPPTPNGVSPPPVVGKRIHSLDDLTLDDDLMDWWRTNAADINPETVMEDLRLYCKSKGKRYKDYRATLMTWGKREQVKFNAKPTNTNHSRTDNQAIADAFATAASRRS